MSSDKLTMLLRQRYRSINPADVVKEEVEEGIAAVKIEHDECFYVCPVLSAKDGSLYAQSKTFPPTRG